MELKRLTCAASPFYAAELRVIACNDLFGMGSPLGVIASVRGLRRLSVEDCHCRLYREPVAELGRLTAVRPAQALSCLSLVRLCSGSCAGVAWAVQLGAG